MLVLVATVLALVSPMLFGGQMSRLAYVQLRGWWILFGALAAQIVIIELVPGANRPVLESIHMATYVLAGVFVAINWRVPGLVIIALGGLSNGITIALNGGTLPASASALQLAGITPSPDEFLNSGVLPDPAFAWLGDMFAWPAPMPFANVYSVGDLLIVLGVLYGAHTITGSRLARHAWAPAGSEHAMTLPASEESKAV